MKLKKFSIIAVVSGLILLIISLLPVFLNENYRFRENDWNFCMFLFAVAFIVYLSYYVKHVLFKLRTNPQPADRVLRRQIQKKI